MNTSLQKTVFVLFLTTAIFANSALARKQVEKEGSVTIECGGRDVAEFHVFKWRYADDDKWNHSYYVENLKPYKQSIKFEVIYKSEANIRKWIILEPYENDDVDLYGRFGQGELKYWADLKGIRCIESKQVR